MKDEGRITLASPHAHLLVETEKIPAPFLLSIGMTRRQFPAITCPSRYLTTSRWVPHQPLSSNSRSISHADDQLHFDFAHKKRPDTLSSLSLSLKRLRPAIYSTPALFDAR